MDHANDPLIGRVLDGRYRVGPRIARGGMAVVYEGTDLRLDRTVAVKVMHAGLADDEEFVGRFEREARSAARLAHHNVVAVFDQGDDHGTLFLVMEYVPGITLRDLIRKESPMSPAKALALLDPVLSALNAAHQAGMIHRDVKPENVLLTDVSGSSGPATTGGIKVADFGLARAVNAETQHTATGGVLIGTVSYLAPELVVDGRADARADVYAAGVLLYEMLTGRKPHQADTPIQIAYKHVHEDIPPPSAVVGGIPPYVDALVARATARDTSLRPADAGVLLHQVRRVRQALDHGVTDDPELTADLSPVRPGHDDTDELPVDLRGGLDTDATEQLRIIDPAVPGALAAYEEAYGLPHDDVFDVDDPTTSVRRASPTAAPPRRPTRPSPATAVAPRPPVRRSRRRRGPLLLAGLVGLIALLALAGWYFGIARYTVTPGVIDLSRTAAEAKVEKAGLHLEVSGRDYSETVARGAVMGTDPDAGSRILKHGTVEVVISRGPERHKVPDVKGMTLDQAQAAIQDAHLAFGRAIPRFNDSVQQGRVINTDPRPGTKQRRNTAIDAVVSKGPRPIKIPDFTGKPVDRARTKLTKLGFTVDASQRDYSDEVPEGKVIEQSPDTGTGHKGDEILLVVSKGPELVTVPSDLQGKSFDDAQQELEALGLHAEGHHSPFYIGLDRVAHVSPGAGDRVRKGSTVTLDLV